MTQKLMNENEDMADPRSGWERFYCRYEGRVQPEVSGRVLTEPALRGGGGGGGPREEPKSQERLQLIENSETGGRGATPRGGVG